MCDDAFVGLGGGEKGTGAVSGEEKRGGAASGVDLYLL